MTRYEMITKMSVKQLAQKVIGLSITDSYCKSDCGNDEDCTHELDCCIKWLNEDVSSL